MEILSVVIQIKPTFLCGETNVIICKKCLHYVRFKNTSDYVLKSKL